MKLKALILASLLLIPLGAADEPVVKMDIRYDDGEVTLEDYQVTNGYLPPQTSGDAEYLLRITNSSATVYSTQFNIERQVNIDGPEGGESRMLNETTKRLIAPYTRDSEKIEIYRDRRKIIEENISQDNVNIDLTDDESSTPGQGTNQSEQRPQQDSGGGIPWSLILPPIIIIIIGTVIYLSIVPEEK